MKQFTRIEPTIIHKIGRHWKREIVEKTFQTEDGKTHEFTTFHSEEKRAGAVIALTKDNQVITAYQFRPGPERWLYELPGGAIEPSEDPGEAITRELREETGYVPGKVIFLGENSRDAYMNAKWYYYLALDCELHQDGNKLDTAEDDQGLELCLITIDTLIENAKTDQMSDPVAVLMAYEKLKELQNGRK